MGAIWDLDVFRFKNLNHPERSPVSWMAGFMVIAAGFLFLQNVFHIVSVNEDMMKYLLIYGKIKQESPFYERLGYSRQQIEYGLGSYYLLFYFFIVICVTYICIVIVWFRDYNIREQQIWTKLNTLGKFNIIGAFVLFMTGIYMSLFPSSDLTVDMFRSIASYNITLYMLLHLFLFSGVIFLGAAAIPVFLYRKARAPVTRA